MGKEQEIGNSAEIISGSLEREKPLSGVFATASNRRQQRNIDLVRTAVENGDFLRILTEKQQEIFKSRGYFEEGQLIPIKNLEKVKNGTITYQAVSDMERRALRRLSSPKETSPRSRTRMKPREEEFIKNNPHLSTAEIARRLGHVRKTIGRYKSLAGVSRMPVGRPKKNPEADSGQDNFKIHRRNPRGRPKKELPSDLVARLYSEGLNVREIGKMFRCSHGTIFNRLRDEGVSLRRPGRAGRATTNNN